MQSPARILFVADPRNSMMQPAGKSPTDSVPVPVKPPGTRSNGSISPPAGPARIRCTRVTRTAVSPMFHTVHCRMSPASIQTGPGGSSRLPQARRKLPPGLRQKARDYAQTAQHLPLRDDPDPPLRLPPARWGDHAPRRLDVGRSPAVVERFQHLDQALTTA